MFRRKAFLHCVHCEGMDDDGVHGRPRATLNDLISEYQQECINSPDAKCDIEATRTSSGRGRQVIQHFNNSRIVATATRRPGAVEADRRCSSRAAARRLLGCFLNVRQPKIAVKPHASRCAALPMQLMLVLLMKQLRRLRLRRQLTASVSDSSSRSSVVREWSSSCSGGTRSRITSVTLRVRGMGGRCIGVAGADRGAALGARCCCCCCFGGGGGEASLKAPTAEEAAAAAAAAVRARCLASASCRLCSSSPLRVSAVAARR
uniref:Uncharacterized protein n=1 Tax=Macrostomum lignano TaxID=282301 RepID=A0A1I8JQA5_9PLAT